MNIESKNAYTIFRNDVNGKTFYKIGLSKKKQDGTFENGYVPIQFKKGVDIPNQTKIYLRSAWWTFYNKVVSVNGADHKETIPYIFCNDYITLEDRMTETRADLGTDKKKDTVYTENMISDEDLPF